MAESTGTLRGISEIRAFFRTNQTPIYFVSPTAFNLLGIDRWLRSFFYVNYFDSFEGNHPRVFVPKERPYREFESMEDVCNYLLEHKEVLDRIQAKGGGGKAVFVMFDDETERAAAAAGLEIAHPSAELRHRLDSKIVTTQLGNEAGVPSAPNTLGRATHLRRAARARRVRRARRRPRGADALRRLGQDDVLHPRRARLGQGRGRDGRPGAQGHAAHQLPRGRRRGGADPARDGRRPADDRPHRASGADAAQGRLVRQRHLPRRALARASRARPRLHPAARRPARGRGLPRLPGDRLPRRHRHRRALPRRDQPAHQRRDVDDERDRGRVRRRPAVPVPHARVPRRRLRDRRRRHQPALGRDGGHATSGARSSSRTPATRWRS